MAAMKELVSCVRGCHVYQAVWTPTIGDKLTCRREVGNAVAVYSDDNLVGHLPKKISIACSLFLRHGGRYHVG